MGFLLLCRYHSFEALFNPLGPCTLMCPGLQLAEPSREFSRRPPKRVEIVRFAHGRLTSSKDNLVLSYSVRRGRILSSMAGERTACGRFNQAGRQ